MSRQFISFLLLCIFTPIAFQRVVIVMDYYTNPASFVKACINKSKPRLQCKGNCQLMIKLKQEEKNDKQNPERKLSQKEEIVAFHTFLGTPDQILILNQNPVHPFFPSFAPPGFVHAIFHPPALI